ncbi:toxin HicA [Mycolicibacterium vaccae]|uniref:toxin HicA n=1 Tax=Mycolicibacterium vaccae TaxID=1810 RepID=UPI003CFFD056
MASVEKIEAKMREAPANVAYADLKKVCDHYFGAARQQRSSHAVYRTPWQGNPRVNIQNDHGKAKSYQVKQVLEAIAKLNETGREGN